MEDGRTDRHMDAQRETIIPCHYCVAGYKIVAGYKNVRKVVTHRFKDSAFSKIKINPQKSHLKL